MKASCVLIAWPLITLTLLPAAAQFRLESFDFGASSCFSTDSKSFLPDKNFGLDCGDRNETPRVSWSGAPFDTGSLVLTITSVSHDEGVLPHLLVWDIPENMSKIAESVDWRDTGAQLGSSGSYSGPCPVSREACIRLSLYAIADRTLGLPAGATYEELHRRLLEISNTDGLLDAAVLYAVAIPHQRDSIRTGA